MKSGDLAAVKGDLTEYPDLLDATNETGQSAFLLAKYYRREAVAEYLLSLKPKMDIYHLCIAGDASAVLAKIAADPTLLEAHNSDGWTPLHLAAFFGQVELANVLIDRGADVNARSTNSMKNTPLHAAAAGGNVQAVDLLLKRGADANATQEGGWTALHSAAQSGNRAMVETLIAQGADVNVRAANNQSPLDMALLKGHQEIVELLEQLGAKL